MTQFLAAYAVLALLLAVPVWQGTGRRGHPIWLRIFVTLMGPMVLAEALIRRATLGHW